MDISGEQSAIPIDDAYKVVRLFGGWPNFHDAEVLTLELHREDSHLVLRIYTFETTGEIDESGFYKRVHECTISMRFDGIEDLLIENFNHQNVLAGLNFEERNGRLTVEIEPIFGVYGKFSCSSARVEEVVELRVR